MPQLMPLNWVLSSIMVSIIIVSACVIYSEEMGDIMVQDSIKKMKNKMELWFW
uniref:ATP synthase F0 subunit 8 n=1 Tax=Argiope ocula TaxID=716557 RepID=A0A6B9RCX5_9ARAC|nr:ATP synthase F0 subunit 8 [Argiope ocula]